MQEALIIPRKSADIMVTIITEDWNFWNVNSKVVVSLLKYWNRHSVELIYPDMECHDALKSLKSLDGMWWHTQHWHQISRHIKPLKLITGNSMVCDVVTWNVTTYPTCQRRCRNFYGVWSGEMKCQSCQKFTWNVVTKSWHRISEHIKIVKVVTWNIMTHQSQQTIPQGMWCHITLWHQISQHNKVFNVVTWHVITQKVMTWNIMSYRSSHAKTVKLVTGNTMVYDVVTWNVTLHSIC